MSRCVGLDVHKSVVQSVIIDRRGAELSTQRFSCTRDVLLQFARTTLRPSDRVALEATTNTWGIVTLLKPFVKEVVVSNPLRTKAIASAKVKTDKVDARVLAQLLRADYLPRVWEPNAKIQHARSVTGRRAALVADRTAVKNRIHAVLRQRLIECPAKLFTSAGRTWLGTLDIDPAGRLALESDLRLLDALDQEIEVTRQTLLGDSYENDDVKLLVTLPGFDVDAAQTLHAALGDISRFPDPDRAASYIGVTPSTRQSADHCVHGPITKQGNSRARWMVVQAAQNAAKHPGPLGAFFKRVAKKRGRNIAIVAIARKLVVIAWHMLTKREPYRYANPATTQSKLRRIRTAHGDRRRAQPGTKMTRQHVSDHTRMMRRIPSLPEVYTSEGLPELQCPPSGELKMLKEKQLTALATNLDVPQWVPKNATKRHSSAKKRKDATKPLTRT